MQLRQSDGCLVAPALCLTEVGGEGLQASDVSPHPGHLRLAVVVRLRRARHGVHVSIGIVMLMSLYVSSTRGNLRREQAETVEIVGLYWHFVDGIWVVLFIILYLL